MSNGIKSWSPSAFAEYQKCPRRHKYKKIDKLPDPPGPALERGTAIHAHAENYINGTAAEIHPDLVKIAPRLKKLRAAFKKKAVLVELEFAFTEKWERTEWFAKDAWLRLKLDVLERKATHTEITDWKTGKLREDDPSYADQLNLYAVAALVAGMGTETKAQLVFTDHGKAVKKPEGTLTLDGLEAAKASWEQRVRPMFMDKFFAPNPSFACKWCPFSKARGGPCDF